MGILRAFFRSQTFHTGVFYFSLLFVLSVSATIEISDALLLRIHHKYGQPAVQRVEEWSHLMRTAKNLPEKEKLRKVNDFFNTRIQFVGDLSLWGVKDYWATPLEFLSVGQGDCEDYSIAKYFTLKELGVAEKKMRITYVKAIELKQAHMVLTYYAYPRAVPVVLDNLISSIKQATQRKDLLPVYSFNGKGLWLAKSKGNGKRVGESSRLSHWMGLKKRMLSSII
ncbi:MAG: transglutaminase-like cysteine peptidase [Methylococcales bacterium]|nr:transglutaminase-like cysteine peptidase [Methylococcales bacterium]